MVVWTSDTQDNADGSYGIYAQRYTASGVAAGPEFRVNTATTGHQIDASTVGLSDGGFMVTWTDQTATDGSSYGVYAQRYDASGDLPRHAGRTGIAPGNGRRIGHGATGRRVERAAALSITW